MKLIINEQTIQIEDTTNVDKVIKKINDILEREYFFSHFIADGIEIYDEHEEYLRKHVGTIQALEVIAKTEGQFVNDLLLAGEEYLHRGLPELPSLAEAFYENPTIETWTRLEQLLGGLQWLNEMLMSIGRSETVLSNWSRYLSVSVKMQEEIRYLAEAMENEDYVLIGDLVQYEIQPVLEDLMDEIRKTIDNEGTRHDLN